MVDERDRAAAGRPWLTLAIDVRTRAVLGFYASLDPPSCTSIALCLAQACLPKDTWLASRDLSHVSWPMCGIPKVLRADNGRDFRSEALRRGCDEAGIALEFRPPATPHFGGHIERLIGSVMGRLHLLPGTTFSNPKARGKYNSAKHAAFTLAEFERYLALEIAERYHNSFHRGLRSSPTLAWQQAVMTLPSHRIPADPTRFLRGFLPVEFRRLQKDGIWLFNIRYWSDVLPTIGQRHEQLVVRYDPRNLAKVFVLAPDKSYVEVPYADVRHPPISLWDLKAAARFLIERGEKKKTEQRLFWANGELARMATTAITETRRVRRLRARRETTTREQHRTVIGDRNPNSVEVDYSRTPRELPVEPGTIGRHR